MKFHLQGCQRGLNNHSGEEFSFFPFVFLSFLQAEGLHRSSHWSEVARGRKKANVGCIILSHIHYSLTQREMPPAPQNGSVPWKVGFKLGTPNLKGKCFQNQWRERCWTGTSPCAPTGRCSRWCSSSSSEEQPHSRINGFGVWMLFFLWFYFLIYKDIYFLSPSRLLFHYLTLHKAPWKAGADSPMGEPAVKHTEGILHKMFSSLLVKSLAAAAEGAALVQLHLEHASKPEHYFILAKNLSFLPPAFPPMSKRGFLQDGGTEFAFVTWVQKRL